MCSITTSAVSLPFTDSIYRKRRMMMEIVEYGVPYVIMPMIGVYIVYEFIKLLIISYNEKKNGKN